MKKLDFNELERQLDSVSKEEGKKIQGGTYGFNANDFLTDIAANWVGFVGMANEFTGHAADLIGWEDLGEMMHDNAEFTDAMADAYDDFGEHTDTEQFMDDIREAVEELAGDEVGGS